MRERLEELGAEWLALLKWSLMAGAVGAVVGVTIGAFQLATGLVAGWRLAHPGVLWLLPLAGGAIALLYRACGLPEDPGANLVIQSVRTQQAPKRRQAPLIFIASLLTQLVGGSSGRTGASLQMGGSIASGLGELFRPTEKERHVLILCGMAAAFSALFGAPVTGAFFALEVISVGEMVYSALAPTVVAALTARGVMALLGLPPTTFPLEGIPSPGLSTLVQGMLLAGLCAMVSILFCEVVHGAGKLYRHFFKNSVVRAMAGGALLLVLTLLVGSGRYSGPGGELVLSALDGGGVFPWDFLLKILFTAVTLGAGFKGGEVYPAFCVGAAFGYVAGPLLGLSPEFSAALGLIALFCGVTNCPVSSLLLSLEFFGGEALPLFLAAVAVSYMLSGYTGLFSAQKILYGKSRPEYINIHTQ